MHTIMLAVSPFARVFRNNVGFAYRKDGTPWGNVGLTKGAPDLIGWTPVVITPDMAGRIVAVFTAIEVKSGRGKTTAEQRNFLDRLATDGGIAVITGDVDDTERFFREVDRSKDGIGRISGKMSGA